MNVCVVIPVHNEADTIGRVVESLRERGLDMVVIDDGSEDGSGAIASGKGAKVIRHETKQGKGISLRDGFRYALKNGYDGVMAMDGDGQHDTAEIGRFLQAAAETGAGVINGNRMDDTTRMPLIRRWTNRFMSGIISRFCGQAIPDSQCGFRLIRSEVLRDLRLTSTDFEIETELLIQASRAGHKIRSIPIKTIYRGEASKINPCVDTLRFFGYIGKEIRRR